MKSFAAKRLFSSLVLLAAAFATGASSAEAEDWGGFQVVADDDCNYQDPGAVASPEWWAACDREWRCVRWIGGAISKGTGTIDEESRGNASCDTCTQCALPDPLRHKVICNISGEYSYNTNITIETTVGVEGGVEWLKGKVEGTFGLVDGEPITWNVACGTDEWPPCLKGEFAVLLKIEKNIPLKGQYLYNTSVVITGPDDPCLTGADGVRTTSTYDHTVRDVVIGTMDRGLEARCVETIPDPQQVQSTGTNCPAT